MDSTGIDLKEKEQIASGGTVLSMATMGDTLWLASPDGLFASDGVRSWPVVREVPFWGSNVLLAEDETLLVAGLPHGLIRSVDNGGHWRRALIEQTEKPITCLAASPNMVSDGVVLAGTAGDGVLRSTDGGRYWALANFGLRDFEVLAIACAPAWGRREIAVAATGDGIYQSPNGGRAWRRIAGSAEFSLQSLLFSPNFAEDQTVFGGTMEHGLAISEDAGMTWRLSEALPHFSITVLGLLADGRLAGGTGEGGVFVSGDVGKSWEEEPPPSLSQRERGKSPAPILSLCEYGGELLAGTFEAGLVGRDGIVARRFGQLLPVGNGLAASESRAGVWRKIGDVWDFVATDGVIRRMAAHGNELWALAGNKLWLNVGDEWRPALEARDEVLSLAVGDGVVAVGFAGGGVYFRPKGDVEWQRSPVAWQHQPVVALSWGDGLFVAITFDPKNRQTRVWICDDLAGGWESVGALPMPDALNVPTVAILDAAARSFAIGLHDVCYVRQAGDWQEHRITSRALPISGMCLMADGALVVATLGGVKRFDGTGWEIIVAEEGIVDVVASGEGVRCLTMDGRILS